MSTDLLNMLKAVHFKKTKGLDPRALVMALAEAFPQEFLSWEEFRLGSCIYTEVRDWLKKTHPTWKRLFAFHFFAHLPGPLDPSTGFLVCENNLRWHAFDEAAIAQAELLFPAAVAAYRAKYKSWFDARWAAAHPPPLGVDLTRPLRSRYDDYRAKLLKESFAPAPRYFGVRIPPADAEMLVTWIHSETEDMRALFRTSFSRSARPVWRRLSRSV